MKLGEVCDFEGGSQPPKSEWVTQRLDGYVRMLQIRDFTKSRNFEIEYVKMSKKLRLCKSDDILIGRYGASVGKILTGLDGAYNVAIIKSIPNESVLSKNYIRRYFESSLFQNHLTKICNARAAQAGFSKEDICDLQIPIPPLSDQQRIVTYLDAEFAKIEALKANAEKQLQAAKDLFQAALKELLTPKDGWKEKSIKDIALLKAGKTLNKKDVIDNCKQGYYPVYGGNGQRGFVPYYNQDGEFNIIGRQGALCGNINIARGKFYATEHAVLVHPIIDVDFKFLNYALIKANINQYATGSAQPGISVANINNLLFLHIPPFAEQQQIANKLDAISAKVKALQTNYTETITLCNDLKQALLKKVFE